MIVFHLLASMVAFAEIILDMDTTLVSVLQPLRDPDASLEQVYTSVMRILVPTGPLVYPMDHTMGSDVLADRATLASSVRSTLTNVKSTIA